MPNRTYESNLQEKIVEYVVNILILAINYMSENKIPAGLAGVPVTTSSISSIDGEKGILKYRGFTIEELTEKSSFTETAYLLIYGKLPNQEENDLFTNDINLHRRLKYKMIDMIKCLPDNGHPMDATQALIAVLGMFYPFESKEFTKPEVQRLAITRLISKMPSIVAAYHRMRYGDLALQPKDDLDYSSNFLYMLSEIEPDPEQASIMEKALILHMEHTMNASTFSARVTGSTLADPFTVISSAVGTLTGPLHGGANEQVLVMLQEIGSVKNTEKAIDTKLKNKDKIMGFGHRVYKVKDPRAKILQKLAEQLFLKYGSNPLYDIAVKVEEVMEKRVGEKGIYPNVDFYSALVYDKLRVQSDLFTPIFAMARVVGWLAHWVEQMQDNRIYRPKAIYVGPTNNEYLPVDKR